MYFPDGKHDEERYNYPKPSNVKFQPSIWYVDVIDGVEFDEYGIATFIDKYLDVIFTPEGDIKIDDRDELDEALHLGELSKQQYDSALSESDEILKAYCADIRQTDAWCAKIRQLAEEKIAQGEPIKACKEVLEQRMKSRSRNALEL